MKKMVKTVTIIGAILVAAAVISGCRGPHGGVDHEKKMDYAVYFISGELDFDEAQKSQLENMKDEIAAKMKQHKQERESEKQYIADLVRSNEVTSEKIDEIFEKHQARMEEMKPFIKEKILEFNEMLNNDQRNKVADYIEKSGRGRF